MTGMMLAALALTAALFDLRFRRIPNWLTAGGWITGVAAQTYLQGWPGAKEALLGSALGFGVYAFLFSLRAMGGGDVKLMAGFGAILGPSLLLWAALWTAAAGGLFALAGLGFYRLRRWWLNRPPDPQEESIPYAPAIAVGAWLALLSR